MKSNDELYRELAILNAHLKDFRKDLTHLDASLKRFHQIVRLPSTRESGLVASSDPIDPDQLLLPF